MKTESYEIVRVRDLSYSIVVRKEYRVRVCKPLTLRQLDDICREIVEKHKRHEAVNAICFFFYLPDTDTDGMHTAGKADWAPDHDWSLAHTVRTGDYRKHAFRIDGI